MNKLDSMIDALLVQRLTAMLGDTSEPANAPEPTVTAPRRMPWTHAATKQVRESTKVRSTRITGPTTAYAIQQRDVDTSVMTNGVRVTYDAMRKAIGRKWATALTENDVIRAVGRKDDSAKKAAQAAIWWLRNHDARGKRVKPNSKAAIVVNRAVV